MTDRDAARLSGWLAVAKSAAGADEWSAYWLYTRALIAFQDDAGDKPATLKLLKDARSSNEHVPAILAGFEPPVPSESGYVTMGGPDEATYYVLEFGGAWKDAPGVIAWLIDKAGRVSRKRPTAESRVAKP